MAGEAVAVAEVEMKEEENQQTISNGKSEINKKSEKKESSSSIASLRELYMLADKSDRLVLCVGFVAAAMNGLGDPILIVLFSNSLSALSDPNDAIRVMSKIALIFVGVGAALQVAATIQYVCFTRVAKNLTLRMRKKWYAALLRQETCWFDENNPSGLAAKMAATMMTYEQGLGGQLGIGVQFLSGFVGSVIIAFYFNAYVALLTVATMPLCSLAMWYMLKLNDDAAESKERCYSRANSLAYEAFVGLKTVLSLNCSDKIQKKYEEATNEARKAGIVRSIKVGFATGSMLTTMNLMYLAITLFGGWALSVQIEETGCDPSGVLTPRFPCNKFNLNNEMDGVNIFIALICIAQGAQALSSVSRSLDMFTSARKAIKAAVDVMNHKPSIDIEERGGLKLSPEAMKGHVIFEKVRFSYPTRPDVSVCEDFSLNLKPGTTVALAGESGCGKSTITQLLQRFYDPLQGRILLDGHDIKDLNLKWLRQNIAIVAQEPKLFSGSISDNIAWGSIAAGRQEDKISQEEIVEAAKMANAHDFVMEFQKGYDTEVGFGGSQLSGGQKQRIAIARALLKNPKILLLDEATSALDNKSEKTVQEALDRLLKEGRNRTTVVIAHRLSTIRGADVICYVQDGRIIERGSHAELIQIEGGHYRSLVEKQQTDGTADDASGKLNSRKAKAQKTAGEKDLEENVSIEMQDPSGSSQALSEELASKGVRLKNEESEVEKVKVEWSRIFAMSKPDLKYLVIGVVSGAFAGALYPFWGFMFAKMVTIFLMPVAPCMDDPTDSTFPSPQMLGYPTCSAYFQSQGTKLWVDSLFLSYWYIALSVVFLASFTIMFWGFGASSENLSHRVRCLMFQTYLRQEPGYFDQPDKAVGSVSSCLANDATLLKAKTGEPLQQIVMALFGCVGGIVLACVYCWPIALMAIGIMPVLGIAITLQTQIILGGGKESTAEDPKIGALAGESLTAMRTVTSFSMEETFKRRYEAVLGVAIPTKDLLIKALGFGISFSVQHWAFALLFWFGAWVMDKMSFGFEDFSIALFAFFFGLFGLSLAASGATDTKEATRALTNIFQLLDRETKIDPASKEGLVPAQVAGDVAFADVDFKYPTRESTAVLKGLSFNTLAGQKVGLVGPSGSGKSTVIQLIERFYEAGGGTVSFDGNSVGSVQYSWLHDQISLVSQEPLLFSGTVADNIALGWKGVEGEDSAAASMEQIQEVARLANADAFIRELPLGYQTDLGPGGSLLSGGQKQRIAIARALISKPHLLLLDEATSALDNASEAVVQDTLDRLMKSSGITTIMIAHRLSTVRDMNVIIIVDEGKIDSFGTHDQLMKKKGLYFNLVRAAAGKDDTSA